VARVEFRRIAQIHAILRIACAVVLTAALLTGCDRAAKPDLAPRLLFDGDAMAAYLEEFPKDDYQIAEVAGVGRFYIDDNPAQVKKTLLRGEPWEPHVIRELDVLLAPGDVVLDIGAHIGSMTVPIATRIGPEGRVYAFEPQKKIYRELVHNLELNGLTNAVPLRFALSSEPGIIEMNPATAHDGRVSVGHGGDEVEARTVDSFRFPKVSLMKIDVEGHELKVLRGADETIRAHHPAIIIEIWKEDRDIVIPILEGYGYAVRWIQPTTEYVAIYKPDQ